MRKLLLLVLIAIAASWWLSRPQIFEHGTLSAAPANLSNGELVFHAGGCASCHGEDLAGGLVLNSRFGAFHVPNITPDADSGIGGWSTEDLADAMISGVSPAGRHYYPAFPYTAYTRMTAQDVVDLKAYLDTFTAVETSLPDHELAFPWNMRRGIGWWKRLYLIRDWKLATSGNAQLERGRYLVEALGHCDACHTPRNGVGGPLEGVWLAGAPNPDGDGNVPNITPHEAGLADWTAADIAYYLESGFTPEYDTVGGSMVAVQENFARLSAEDRAAVAAYLKAIPAVSR